MKKILLGVATILLLTAFTFASGASAQKIIVMQNAAQRTQQQANVKNFPQEVLRLVNNERNKVGLPPLKFANDLAASALIRAREIPIKFSHTRPNGSKCFTAMTQIGHILGENLAADRLRRKLLSKRG